jgi:flavin-dependent dehydrogenase
MRVTYKAVIGALLTATLAQSAAAGPLTKLEADVVVFDSTPAGITAAIAAARAGKRVVMVSEFRHVGGMQTSGLGNTNAGQRDTFGGLAGEFHQRILTHYRDKYGRDSEQVRVCSDGFHFEPHVALKVYRDWLAEAGVTCLNEEAVLSVRKDGTRIVSVRTDRGREIKGSVFVDASYEGDLLKLAGCSYRVGREASKEHGEPLAGIRYPPEKLGQADDKIQPYDYRCA